MSEWLAKGFVDGQYEQGWGVCVVRVALVVWVQHHGMNRVETPNGRNDVTSFLTEGTLRIRT